MKNTNRSLGKVGLAATLAISLTGCVIYEEPPVTHTTYIGPPVVEPPPPPAPVVVTPSVVITPTVVAAPGVVVIRSETDFYEPLSPYGEWIVTASFGRSWRPYRVEAGWRPYSNGYWQRTEAGWYWASDEPWGWATYHYGRWDWSRQYGWLWVPQTQWAPAWVTWRAGSGYIGWAPLPPGARISVSGTVDVGDAIIAPRFVFVEERRMLEPVRPRTVIVNNTTVINQTVNITKIKVVNQTVINEGPRTEVVERATGQRVHARAARELRHQEETQFTARKRNNSAPDEHRVQPPVRVEVAPVTPAPPRDARPLAKPEELVREQRPPQINNPVREPAVRAVPARPSRPQLEEPVREEKISPGVLPVAARPEFKPDPKPEVPREVRRVEKSIEPVREEKELTVAPAAAKPEIKPEVKPAPKPAVQPRRDLEVGKPAEPARKTPPPAAARNSVPAKDNRQLRPGTVQLPVEPAPKSAVSKTEKRVQAPKEKTPATDQNKARARGKAQENQPQPAEDSAAKSE